MNVCHCQTQYCGAEWAAEEEKYEKKKSEEKTSAETIRHLVLQTACLITECTRSKRWCVFCVQMKHCGQDDVHFMCNENTVARDGVHFIM